MTRLRGRIIATAIVAGAVTLAYAAATPGDAIVVTPRIAVIRHSIGVAGSSAVTVKNTGTAAFTVGSITYDCGAAPAMRLAGGSGANPFTLAANATKAVVVECPAGLTAGMHRCMFTLRDAGQNPVIDVLGVCESDGAQQLTVAPAALDFANINISAESVAKPIIITNASATAVTTLQLQLDDDNFLIGAPCQNEASCDSSAGVPAGGSTTVGVICKPTSSGPHTGRLFAVGGNGFSVVTPVQLICDGELGTGPVLTLAPASIDLTTPVEVVAASAPATIRIANTGTGTLTVATITVADDGVAGARFDWTVLLDGQCTATPCELAAGQTMNVRLTFDPSAFNARPAKLIVNYTDPAIKQQSADLDGSCRGATLELASSGTTLDFGTLPLATAGTQTFALQNRGNRTTTAMLSASPPAPFGFPATVVVAPSTAPVVTVTCQSATPTVVTRTLAVTAGDDVTTLPLELTLVCEVRDTAIQATPGAHAFGEVRLGNGPVTTTFHIARVGAGAPIAFTVALADPSNPNLVLGAPSAAQTPADVTLTVDPMLLGPFANTITVTAMAMQPLAIPISGEVVDVTVSAPVLVSLGTFCIGQPTTPTTLALASNGTGTLKLPAAPALATSPSEFTLALISPPGYPAQLDPMSEATVIVTPPRGQVAGVLTDTVRWHTELGDTSTNVAATYIDDGGAITPDALTFAATPIRVAVDNTQQITLQNCSTTPLELDPVMPPDPFVIRDSFPAVLEPGKKATFGVAFQPTEVGHYEKALVVTSRAGDTYVVTLVGDGISDGGPGEDDGPGLGSTSFYACSGCASHEPRGVLAIALALVCACAPRRRRR
ncbi:MAG: choice-of-anchor D domain-containing protein [Kofleriaceae bacterium]